MNDEAPLTLDDVVDCLRTLQKEYQKFPDVTTFEYGVAWLLEDIERRNK